MTGKNHTASPKTEDQQPPIIDDENPPIITCHTHIFTGDHVPPWLARTFLPGPLYFILPVSAIVGFLRWWYKDKGPNAFFFGATYKRIVGVLYSIRIFIARN